MYMKIKLLSTSVIGRILLILLILLYRDFHVRILKMIPNSQKIRPEKMSGVCVTLVTITIPITDTHRRSVHGSNDFQSQLLN